MLCRFDFVQSSNFVASPSNEKMNQLSRKRTVRGLRCAVLPSNPAPPLVIPLRCFHSQHRTPRVPQLHTSDELPGSNGGESSESVPTLHVGYLLHRHPIVKPTLHPMERSFGFLLERQHQVYSRHPASESAQHFFRDAQQSVDAHQRTDPRDIRRDFYGLEGYREALHTTIERYQHVPPRVQSTDRVCTLSHRLRDDKTGPPPRRTLQRKLDDYLYLLVQYDNEPGLAGKWGIPFTPLRRSETLRMAAERCLQEPHGDKVDYYMWGCGPQGTVVLPSPTEVNPPRRLFVYSPVYLSGRPNFDAMEPRIVDHAWVSRAEIRQYRDAFASNTLQELLLDISADAYFETL
eukprot:gene1119-654_t